MRRDILALNFRYYIKLCVPWLVLGLAFAGLVCLVFACGVHEA